MKQISYATHISSTIKEIPFTPRNMKFHYHVQNHLSLHSVRRIQLMPSHPIHLRSISILYSYLYKGFLSGLFPSYFPTKTHQPNTGSYFESFELCKVHIFQYLFSNSHHMLGLPSDLFP